jgi:hypothetical protein
MSVDISLQVRLDQVRAELGKIPGLTEKEVGRAVKGAELAWRRMPAAAKKAAAESAASMRSVTSSIAAISPAAGAATGAVQSLGAALGPGMAAALGPIGLAVAAIAAIGGGAVIAANRMSTLVDQVELLGEHTGLSTRSVIAIRHAVASAGGDINKTKEALARFNRVLGPQLAGKTGPEVDAMLRRTIARIEGIADPAARAAERMRIFGSESALALAGLTGGALDRAAEQTQGLADRMGRASSSSAQMDRANASLQRSLDELTVVLGDKVAPAVATTTDAITGLVDATTMLTDSAIGAGAQWFITGGLLGQAVRDLWRYRDGTRELARSMQSFDRELAARAVRLRRVANEQRMAADIEGFFGFEFTPRETDPAIIAAEKEARAKAIERARKTAEEVAKATAEVQRQFRQDAIWDEADALAERAAMLAQGEQMQAALDAEEAAAHAEKMRRLSEEMEMTHQLRLARMDATAAVVSGAADAARAIGANSKIALAAGAAETAVNAYTAISRAYAEGGPFVGPILAATVAAQLGPIVASVRALAGGGSGGGLRGGGGGGGQRERGGVQTGFTGRDASGNTIMVAEYRGEIYDAQSYDALRRPGSPLRDLDRRQRVRR